MIKSISTKVCMTNQERQREEENERREISTMTLDINKGNKNSRHGHGHRNHECINDRLFIHIDNAFPIHRATARKDREVRNLLYKKASDIVYLYAGNRKDMPALISQLDACEAVLVHGG